MTTQLRQILTDVQNYAFSNRSEIEWA